MLYAPTCLFQCVCNAEAYGLIIITHNVLITHIEDPESGYTLINKVVTDYHVASQSLL